MLLSNQQTLTCTDAGFNIRS